jgi:pimeloyl-ACP methyl ester carboxylesterase
MGSRTPSEHRGKPTVLLLTGVGLTAAIALRSIDRLTEHFRVLALPLDPVGDGAAREDDLPLTVEHALARLDRAGVEQAHVVGLSFGGVIAQELAIRHPRRVRSLVLASSSAGGEQFVAPEPAIRHFLRGLNGLPVEESLWAAVPYLYAATTRRHHAPLIGEDIAQRFRRPLDPRAYRRQYDVARAHDTSARLDRIAAPTLVMHGEQDRVAPLENGRRLAAGISGAHFIPLPGGAHAIPTDVPDAAPKLVSFLLAHSRP